MTHQHYNTKMTSHTRIYYLIKYEAQYIPVPYRPGWGWCTHLIGCVCVLLRARENNAGPRGSCLGHPRRIYPVSLCKRSTNAAWCATNQRGIASCRVDNVERSRHETLVHSSRPWLRRATVPKNPFSYLFLLPCTYIHTYLVDDAILTYVKNAAPRIIFIVQLCYLSTKVKGFSLDLLAECSGCFVHFLQRYWRTIYIMSNINGN